MNSFDASILSFFEQFSRRSPVFDHFVVYLEDSNLLKAGFLFAAFWYFWFAPRDLEKHRASILATLSAATGAVLAARAMANMLPFRERPLNIEDLHFKRPLGMTSGLLEDWSSFPSDHATMFVALAVGVFYLSRTLGLFTLGYVLLVVLLPRVYLGIHFPTDLIAGAILGALCTLLTHRPWIKDRLGGVAAIWIARHPASFYACFFLATYQFVMLFDGVRDLAKFIVRAIAVSRSGRDWDDYY